jgi:hypothetical protein
MRTLSIRIMQFLTRMLSMRINFPFSNVPEVYAQDKRKNSKFEKVSSKHVEHTCKELKRALSIHVRN